MSAERKLKNPVREKQTPLIARRTRSQRNKNKTMTRIDWNLVPFNINVNKSNL